MNDAPAIQQQVTWIYTADLPATARFYEEILALPLVLDQGACRIYRTGAGAFLGLCKVRDGRWVEPRGVVLTLVTDAVDAWHARLVAHDVEVLGPVDHGIMYSIYFHDPDGNRLEIATPTDDRWNDDAPEARTALAEWNEMKAKAKNTGTSLSSALAALSHRRHGDATEPEL
jgi:catechol-2,3-dioxygenase